MTDYVMVPREKLEEIASLNREIFGHTCDNKTMKLSAKMTRVILSIEQEPVIPKDSTSPVHEPTIWGDVN